MEHFTLLGVFSYSIPGSGLNAAFDEPVPDWLTAELALFKNIKQES